MLYMNKAGRTAEDQLRKDGKKLAEALEARRRASEKLAETVRRAAEEGMTQVAIAQAAKVDRMTVRRYLGK